MTTETISQTMTPAARARKLVSGIMLTRAAIGYSDREPRIVKALNHFAAQAESGRETTWPTPESIMNSYGHVILARFA